MAVVVPSRYDQTLEGYYASQFKEQNAQQKMQSGIGPKNIWRGLRF
jgi:hypothetical protein